MAVNKHMDHVEDLLLLYGTEGAKNAIKALRSVGETLSPSGGPAVTLTTKWDGAPAVICGTDPADGKFFVGTKGVFAQTPKLAKSQSDVQKMYGGGLAEKLSACLRYLPQVVNSGNILQGDLLFTTDKNSAVIDGKSYITFRPNTLTYAVERDSPLGGEIAAAELGIVFHTRYTGNSLAELKASFGVSDNEYTKTGSVWAASATFQNVGGRATMSVEEYRTFTAAVNQAEGSAKQAGAFFDKIQSGKKALQFDTIFLQFFNSYYKKGQKIPGVAPTYNAFIRFLAEKYNTEIQKNKTLKAQADKAFKFVDALDSIQNDSMGMQMLIATYLNITKAKTILVNKLNQVEQMDVFAETSNGFEVTNQEGFVALPTSGAVKLIDRLEFSRLNFTLPKNWG